MCLACEEEAMLFRYELELAVARGVIPEGLDAADFLAAGLPVPGQSKAAEGAVDAAASNPFRCDSPDRE